MKTTKVMLTDQYMDPWKEVDAIVLGSLAVHRNLDRFEGGKWRVSHVPTGASICKCRTKERALKAARAFNKITDWSSVRLSQGMSTYERHKDAIRAIQAEAMA